MESESNPDPTTSAASGLEAIVLPTPGLAVSGESITKSIPLTISRNTFATMKMLKVGVIPPSGCKKRLPRSGQLVNIQMQGSGEYQIKTSGSAISPLRQLDDWADSRSIKLDESGTQLFVESLRLTQLLIQSHHNRIDVNNPITYISHALWDLLGELEETMNGLFEHASLQTKFNALSNIYLERLNHLEEIFDTASDHSQNTHSEFPLGRDVQKFVTWKPNMVINARDYLHISPSSEVKETVDESIKKALKDWISFPAPPEGSAQHDVVNSVYPLPQLEISNKLSNPYQEIIDMCETILPHITKDDDGIRTEVNAIKSDSRGQITIEKLLSNQQSPRARKDRLTQLMKEYKMTEVVENTLKIELPGLYEKAVENGEDLNDLMRESADTRGLLKSLDNQLKNIEESIENLTTSRDSKFEYRSNKPRLQNYRSKLSAIRKEKDIGKIQDEIDDFRGDLEEFERSLESTTTRSLDLKSSVLWLGLGQGGSQILRECLMYCLDNLNDARAGSLLNALGVDPKDLITPMSKRRSDDEEIRKQASSDLSAICDEKLHALAVNVGSDIDKLVLPDRPGHFLWGNECVDSDLTDVVRKTRNTLRLDAKQDGSGGATGLGRAYGFARRRQIRKVLEDVGKNKQGGRSPSHVIITHSFAGGSGSGMVLPLLQEVRRVFEPETIVWVMSVGVGDSELKQQAYYNTPFILSDVLQAHYDGIHSPIEPVSEGQWENFSNTMKSERSAMMRHLKSIMEHVIGSGIEDENVMKELETQMSNHNEIWRDKRNKIESQSKSLAGSKEFQKDKAQEEFDFKNFEHLLAKIPNGKQETGKFNEWCEVYEDEGARPALTYWSAWSECASDPLGLFVSGEKEVSKTVADVEDERRKDFVPSLTSKDLDNVLFNLKLDADISVMAENEDKNPLEKTSRKLGNELAPLYHMLSAKWTKLDAGEPRTAFLRSVEQELRGYKSALYNFNKARKQRARQIRALTGSSNDMRVKNIIVSNAHLEVGVEKSNIPVSSAAYTVFNSVLFDLILNIIGSQIPPDGMYITTDAEEFDEEDLVQKTMPPLLVGLLEHRDSLSLRERSFPEAEHSVAGLDQVFPSLFIKENMWDGFSNPLQCLLEPDQLVFLQNSLFDARAMSLLQINPYSVQDQIKEPEMLQNLVTNFLEKWDEEGDMFDNDMLSLKARQNLQIQYGWTGLHFANMIRWISTIEIKTLAEILCKDYSQNQSPLQYRGAQVAKLVEKLDNSWAPYRPSQQPEFKFSTLNTNIDLSNFLRESGQITYADHVQKALPKLGIWHEDMLRAIPPSYLNAYLPPLLVQHDSQAFDEDDRKVHPMIQSMSGWSVKNDLLDGGKLASAPANTIRMVQQMLEKLDLHLLQNTTSRSNASKLRMNPRLQRYLAAIRTVPFHPDDLLLPSRSTASLLPRYLMANDLDESNGNYSNPTFQKAGQVLNWYRYIGLLPEEPKFEWPALLRMLLLCDTDYQKLVDRTGDLAKIMGFEFSKYGSEISPVLEHKYGYDELHIFDNPAMVWSQVSILRRRMIQSQALAEKILANLPESWIQNREGITAWIEILNRADLGDDSDEELAFSFEETEDQSAAVRQLLQRLQEILFEMNQEEKESLDVSQSATNQASQKTRRIVYDFATLLNEGLAQSEYMHPDFNTDRVHFEMTGFSDRVSGRPSGLLCLSHDNGLSVGNYGMIQKTTRENVWTSLGVIDDNKEFFTASHFGPNASMTMVLQKAPTEEAAKQFGNVMDYLAGHTGNADEYLKQTKLHPYVFLYNVLWLPSNIHRWTRVKNVDYIRRFQIPLSVIENHYTDPQKTIQALKSITSEQAYRTGGISLPDDDIRDFEGCIRKDSKYRNMKDLIGVMALRHQLASDKEKLYTEYLSDDEYNKLNKDLSRKAGMIGRDALDPSDKGQADSVVESEWDDLLGGGSDASGAGSGNNETLEQRGKAWFKAYKAWCTHIGGSKSDGPEINIIDNNRDDQASEFQVTEE